MPAHEGGAARTGAGVRKPSHEQTSSRIKEIGFGHPPTKLCANIRLRRAGVFYATSTQPQMTQPRNSRRRGLCGTAVQAIRSQALGFIPLIAANCSGGNTVVTNHTSAEWHCLELERRELREPAATGM
jgi:hypothetical protein